MTIGVQQLMLAVERVRDTFHAAVFSAPDVEAALALTAPGCTLMNLPAQTGASGTEDLRRFLAEDVGPHLPADLTFRRVSRTVDRWRVAEETTVAFVHDKELPWLLPGIAATHRRVEVLAVSVVTVERSLIASYRTHWDQAGLLAQLHLDPADLARGGGVSGLMTAVPRYVGPAG